MTVPLVCPVTREPLVKTGAGALSSPSGRVYPVVNGIPILLPDEGECKRMAEANWHEPGAPADALAFYNASDEGRHYFREDLTVERDMIHLVLKRLESADPGLEIGSGSGALQGLTGDYVALDYSFNALNKHISEQYQRVCGSAEHLPFPNGCFGFIYSVAAIEHVPAPDLAFSEIDRVLRPGGTVFLAPAWHCIQDNCEGIPVRPYGDLTLRQKLRKATLPLRTSLAWKAAFALPARLLRRLAWAASGGGPSAFRFVRLRPDYQHFWMSDSDAVSRLDSHEGALFFHSRGYRLESPGPGWRAQLLANHQPLVALKPSRGPECPK